MKLGIAMLVIGLLFAAVGLGAWYLAANEPYATAFGYPVDRSEYELLMLIQSSGLAGAVFGGGLALGGIVRMIVKR
jgi:uncharacterized membrane protein YciS (DUF1049 family)